MATGPAADTFGNRRTGPEGPW
ncbi:hypothetical protein SBRY_11233 [Actinacidiphila bryophytorum]|uniref:Uncharacterized protein n=1 Tax=Actinacidiphila bryophytorum TaxID=1436133 RepID=A0A9W4E3L7_9ACTN|nr:hypothetical protein SBRY_11233 [Actinacidiphila bryophytorum]